MRNTIRKVTIVVPVFITSCQVSEKWKSGPVRPQTSTIRTATPKAVELPVQAGTSRSLRSNRVRWRGALPVGGWLPSGLGYRSQAGVPPAPLRPRRPRQQGSEAQAHDQDHTDVGVEPSRPRHVALTYSPEDLHSPVAPLYRCPPLITPLELLRAPRDGREASQV